MKNWRTNLGGAISVIGTSLIGVGVLPQLLQLSPSSSNVLSSGQLAALWWVALGGFVVSAIGKGFTALFAADAGTVKTIAASVDDINQNGPSPDAKPLTKPVEPPQPK